MGDASEDAVPGALVADKYRLTRILGKGGMGSVWEGIHISLGTRVAVKFIEAQYAGSTEARRRFENEARAAAKLRSKHVVKVYDHGVSADGRPYIVMEYLAGEPLDTRLDRVGRLTLQETAVILLQVGRALAKAHDAGIVHRDLKPENIFLVWDDDDQADVAKVVDFGIAKFTDAAMGVSSSTRTGSVLGTPYYMSPEQARGLRSVDHRSDLWSLGVIAFRCVAGRLPFDGEAVGDLLVKICTAPVPLASQFAPGLPPEFDSWVLRALARDPAERFGSASELVESLCQVAGVGGRLPQTSVLNSGQSQAIPAATISSTSAGFSSEGGTHSPFSATPPPRKSSPLALIIGLGLLSVLFVGGLGFWGLSWFSNHAEAEAAAAAEPLESASSAVPVDSVPESAESEASGPEPASENSARPAAPTEDSEASEAQEKSEPKPAASDAKLPTAKKPPAKAPVQVRRPQTRRTSQPKQTKPKSGGEPIDIGY